MRLNWMLILGTICFLLGFILFFRALREALDALSKRIPHTWKKWRLVGENPGTFMFYTVVALVLVASIMVLWWAYT